jgi:hypothetical protein
MIVDILISALVPEASRLAAKLNVADQAEFVSGLIRLLDCVFGLGVLSAVFVAWAFTVARGCYRSVQVAHRKEG